MHCSKALFDHLVGGSKNGRRYINGERLRLW